MIQPTVDLTGILTQEELDNADLDAIQEEIARQKNKFSTLESLKLAIYNDAISSPGNDGDIINWPFTFATIPHNLGYVPQFLVYYKYLSGGSTTYIKLPMIRSGADGGAGPSVQRKIGYFFKAYADANNLYIVGGGGFTIGAAQPVGGFQFRYYIFSQPNQ
jgi:hypothetical protein